MTGGNALHSRINRKVRDKLVADDEQDNTQIGISTIDSVVGLFGLARTDYQRDHAALVARQVAGVKQVDSLCTDGDAGAVSPLNVGGATAKGINAYRIR